MTKGALSRVATLHWSCNRVTSATTRMNKEQSQTKTLCKLNCLRCVSGQVLRISGASANASSSRVESHIEKKTMEKLVCSQGCCDDVMASNMTLSWSCCSCCTGQPTDDTRKPTNQCY
eukprot:962359-Amphidinium_carterae.1